MGDEGVGIHATKSLRALDWPDNIDIIDAGVPSLALLHMIDGRKLAIIIDCADFNGAPGEIKTFKPDDVTNPHDEKKASLHAADLLTTFNIAAEAGITLPPVWIVGIQPAAVEMKMELSKEAAKALKHLPAIIRNLIKNHGVSSLH